MCLCRIAPPTSELQLCLTGGSEDPLILWGILATPVPVSEHLQFLDFFIGKVSKLDEDEALQGLLLLGGSDP